MTVNNGSCIKYSVILWDKNNLLVKRGRERVMWVINEKQLDAKYETTRGLIATGSNVTVEFRN